MPQLAAGQRRAGRPIRVALPAHEGCGRFEMRTELEGTRPALTPPARAPLVAALAARLGARTTG